MFVIMLWHRGTQGNSKRHGLTCYVECCNLAVLQSVVVLNVVAPRLGRPQLPEEFSEILSPPVFKVIKHFSSPLTVDLPTKLQRGQSVCMGQSIFACKPEPPQMSIARDVCGGSLQNSNRCCMDKLQLTRQNLARVFYFRLGHVCPVHFLC